MRKHDPRPQRDLNRLRRSLRAHEEGREETARIPDRFEPVRDLGEGGMGTLLLARDSAMGGRLVALKLLQEGKESLTNRRRLEEEACALAALEHPHVVGAHELIFADTSLVLVMEFVPGLSLASAVESQGPLAPPLAARYARDLASALEAAHAARLVHRDVKPGNVLIGEDQEAYLIDFGIARRLDRETRLTHSQLLLGTPVYASPEQLSDASRVDARTDIYSLGATLYEALVGRAPFEPDSLLELLRLVMEEQPESPHELRAEVDEDLAAICLRCLEKDPEDRYQTAAELKATLDSYLAGERKSLLARHWKSITLGLILLVAALIGVAQWVAWSRLESRRDQARTSYADRNWEEARALYEGLADELPKDPERLGSLGVLLLEGRGGPADPERGIELLREAESLGSSRAAFALGNCYRQGKHLPRDLERARDLLKFAHANDYPRTYLALGAVEFDLGNPHRAQELLSKAAEEGDFEAMRVLGLLRERPGPWRSLTRAEEWFRKSAEGGEARSQTDLGRFLLLYGERSEGLSLLERAAERGHVKALLHLAEALLSEDRPRAETLLERAARLDSPRALRALGQLHLNGATSTSSVEKGKRYLREAAAKGDLLASVVLARALLGSSAEDDRAEGLRLLQESAQRGYPAATRLLGQLHEHGRGVPQDTSRAKELYRQAVERGNPDAMIDLGVLLGREGREEEAVGLYRRAAELGHHHAMLNLGNMLVRGRGTPPDWAQAAELFERAQASSNLATRTQARQSLANLRRLEASPGSWYANAVSRGRAPDRLPEGVRPHTREGEYLNRADGSVLVYVPGGVLRWKCEDESHAHAEHVVSVEPFLLGKFEVSRAQFRGGSRNLRYRGEVWPIPDDHPAVGMSLAEAEAYARRYGLRLPTDYEWRLAAKGVGSQEGNFGLWSSESQGDVRDRRDGWPYSAPVGSFGEAPSKAGCLNLLGNVEEWVSTREAKDRSRGGAWNKPRDPSATVAYGRGSRWPMVGFRVARSLER